MIILHFHLHAYADHVPTGYDSDISMRGSTETAHVFAYACIISEDQASVSKINPISEGSLYLL